MCQFPPPPVAICRLEQSVDHQKAQIYYSDRDYKVTPGLPRGISIKNSFCSKTWHACVQGFVQIRCSQNCVVDYHNVCWKALKTSSFSDKNDKVGLKTKFIRPCCQQPFLKGFFFPQDFLQDFCLTPDCQGKIWSIKMFDQTGLQKFKVRLPCLCGAMAP